MGSSHQNPTPCCSVAGRPRFAGASVFYEGVAQDSGSFLTLKTKPNNKIERSADLNSDNQSAVVLSHLILQKIWASALLAAAAADSSVE
jgi:hypothetical protein